MRHFILPLWVACCGGALAQGDRPDFKGDVPIDTYLALIAQVAPSARDGAEAYLAAFRSLCGRTMRTVELRRAFADGNGDPALMGMIRASHERDNATIRRLSASITCPGR